MTMPRRKRRTICVNDQTYYWRTGLFDDTDAQRYAGHLTLIIEAADFPGKRAHAVITPEAAGETARPQGFWNLTATVKPALVRRVLLAALAHGWTPATAPNDPVIPGYEDVLRKRYLVPAPSSPP